MFISVGFGMKTDEQKTDAQGEPVHADGQN